MMAMPAVMLQKKITQSSANSQERMQARAPLPPSSGPLMALAGGGAYPDGTHPAGGFLTKAAQGMVTRRNSTPMTANTLTMSPASCARSSGAITLDINRAPKPNPMTTMPVANPFRSGNHLATVVTGVT